MHVALLVNPAHPEAETPGSTGRFSTRLQRGLGLQGHQQPLGTAEGQGPEQQLLRAARAASLSLSLPLEEVKLLNFGTQKSEEVKLLKFLGPTR